MKNDHRLIMAAKEAAQIAKEARCNALKEALKECDRLASDPRMYCSERRRGAGQCAAAVRALLQKEET